ncbi:unnamed protein product [Callosobruchus maculatus]|uniref:BESS domain-containing protein n=1 Tax=Callosobruchus maculatus TaxID=64391 RepID=A0A653DEL5_CALMS|nr:unnamed protein product [Callosobruchus maculatus]
MVEAIFTLQNRLTVLPVTMTTVKYRKRFPGNQLQLRPPLASPSSNESLAVRKRKQKPSAFHSSASIAFQEYMEHKKLKNNKPADHLSKYFASVEETVRTFPLHLQIKIKSEFSSILHKAEYEAMSYNQSNVSQHPSPIQHTTQLSHQSPLSCNIVQQSLRPQNQELNTEETTLQTLEHRSPTYQQQQSLQTWRAEVISPPQLRYHTIENSSYNLPQSPVNRQEMSDNHPPHYSAEDSTLSPQ